VRADLENRRGVPVNDGELRDALLYFSRAEPSLVPNVYLTLARGQLASGKTTVAAGTLENGIALLENQQAGLAEEAFRISYFDDAWSLYPEMIELQLQGNDEAKAFAYAERARGRSLLNGGQPLELANVQRTLPDSAAMLYYLSLRNRLLIWIVTHREHRLLQVPVTNDRLTRLIAAYRAILSQNLGQSSDSAASLHDVLVRPVSGLLTGKRTVVIVPDGVIGQLPFAALRDRESGRYVIEDFEIVQSPSATFFAAGNAHELTHSPRAFESALLVGNPASNGTAATASLPGAEAEVLTSASAYPRHEVLVGKDATRRAFVEHASRYDVVHFGGHAFANLDYPLLSRLTFSPQAEAGTGDPLFAYEIARMRFTHTRVVVLAACSTAAGGVSRGEGVVSLARPFLAAGVPLVIASQWDVDDAATERLFTTFHRVLARYHDPVAALRAAQLVMLKGNKSKHASPNYWGAFIALGTTEHRSERVH